MLADVLLILGFAVISIGLRGSETPFLFRLGNLCVLVTSYLLGWKLTGIHFVGFSCASSWLLFPWIDIVTRVRHIQMPTDRHLRTQAPPGASRFPALSELTEEIEAEGFQQVEDAGWNHEEHRQYLRLFVHPTENVRATINLVENEHISFFYVSLCTHSVDGTLWCTWNYPFSSSLKPAPNWRLQRYREANAFFDIHAAHLAWIQSSRAAQAKPISTDPAELMAEIEGELLSQLTHNLNCGVLTKADEGQVRYSWRGCFFLWTQFLCDLIRA
ncbi:MAG: hypothetical protein WCO60_12730 [Verrucomicrobiota bacterium]